MSRFYVVEGLGQEHAHIIAELAEADNVCCEAEDRDEPYMEAKAVDWRHRPLRG